MKGRSKIGDTTTSQYTLHRLLGRGDLCNLYVGTTSSATEKKQILLKVPMRPQDNDLSANEARILRHLRAGSNYQAARHFVSQLVDAFPYEEHATGVMRQITVLSYVQGLVSLKEVKEAYPRGIDAKDMAWIWRRVLLALDFAHTNKVIHGSVLPTHYLEHHHSCERGYACPGKRLYGRGNQIRYYARLCYAAWSWTIADRRSRPGGYLT